VRDLLETLRCAIKICVRKQQVNSNPLPHFVPLAIFSFIWKTTSIFENGKQSQFFLDRRRTQFLTMVDDLKYSKMKDDLILFNWKTTSSFLKMEDNLYFSE
jgi:hypothetical protein